MKANKMKNIVNPYPRGVVPFRAIPVRDAFPHHVWAQKKILRGYFALVPCHVPNMLPDRNARGYDDALKLQRNFLDHVRRLDIKHVLACAIDELEDRVDMLRHGERPHKRAISKLMSEIKQLKSLDAEKMRLPREIRVRYTRVCTTRFYRNNNTDAVASSVRKEPAHRLVSIDDIISGGYGYALHHSEEATKVKFAYATLLSAERRDDE